MSVSIASGKRPGVSILEEVAATTAHARRLNAPRVAWKNASYGVASKSATVA